MIVAESSKQANRERGSPVQRLPNTRFPAPLCFSCGRSSAGFLTRLLSLFLTHSPPKRRSCCLRMRGYPAVLTYNTFRTHDSAALRGWWHCEPGPYIWLVASHVNAVYCCAPSFQLLGQITV